MKEKYHIVIGSPIDYEELVAYIMVGNRELALINQDEGRDKIKVEMIDCDGVSIDYDTFIEALQKAKEALLR